jgi:hypothetical protein
VGKPSTPLFSFGKTAVALHRIASFIPLEGKNTRLQLLGEDSESYTLGVIVYTGYLAKRPGIQSCGVAKVTEVNYFINMNRNRLYVDCASDASAEVNCAWRGYDIVSAGVIRC